VSTERVFIVSMEGVTTVDIPEDVSVGYDRLTDMGYSPEKAAAMSVAMKRLHERGETARTVDQQIDHMQRLAAVLRR
jgi:hypothetical protein